MFGKLMKAEWRASRRIIGALCAVVLISGALLGLMGNVLLWESSGSWQLPGFVNVLFSLLSMTAVLAVTLSLAASVFYVLWRYYRSRFTEEGYLTYTLPVNNHQLMLSSILASVLEMLLVALAAMAAVALAFGIFAAGLSAEVSVHVRESRLIGFQLIVRHIGGSAVRQIVEGYAVERRAYALEGNALQKGAVRKRAVADIAHPCRNGHALQRVAVVKAVAADDHQALGQGKLHKIRVP